MRLREFLLATLAGGLLACSPQSGAETLAPPDQAAVAATHPVSGLQIIPVTVTANGTVHRFRTELADTPEAQARGLMFRTELGPDEAMIFPRTERPSPASFWMKNTPLPLDIIFIGLDGRITNIAAQTVPYSLDSVRSQGNVIGVLEIAGGRAAELGIEPGAKVEW